MSALTVGLPRRARMIALLLVATGLSSIVPGTPGAPPAQAAAAPPAGVASALDASFGGGMVTDNLSSLDDEAFAVAVQPDGSTVVVGRTNWDRFRFANGDMLVARYTSAGALDPGFAQSGSLALGATDRLENAYAVAVQADGKILVGGEWAGLAAVVRLTASGALDTDFQGGIITLPEATSGSVKALAVLPDGAIRLGGTSLRWDSSWNLHRGVAFQVRLDPDGNRDATFAPNGWAAGDVPADSGHHAMALLPDGKLLGGGTAGRQGVISGAAGAAAVARYLPTGALDPAFGTDGMVVVDPDTDFFDRSTQIVALAVQPDGRILAAGEESYYGGGPVAPPGVDPPAPTGIRHLGMGNVALFRFLSDGQLDTDFAGTGQVITRVPGQSGGTTEPAADTAPEAQARGTSVAVAADGSILVGGSSRQPLEEPLVLRYTSSGLLDTTFGRAGVLSVDRGGLHGAINALAIRPDGRLAVAGGTWVGWNELPNYHDLLVGRVTPGTNAGTVWTWGWNAVGQLGDGTTDDRAAPVPVPGLSGVVAVSASPYHSLALQGDGTVWAWGWNLLGQLGDGTTVNRLSPRKVPGLTGVVAIAAGGLHSLALKGDGSVWAWGYNGSGQLGDGTTVLRLRPTRTRLSGIIAISAGLFHNLAVREEGSGWAWGYNGQGQVGDGTFVDRPVPVALPALTANYAYARVAAGWLHSSSASVIGDGRAWGYDQLGQVSAGPGGPSIATPGNFIGQALDVTSGGYHGLGLQVDGTVRSWGWNAHGQLGQQPPAAYFVTGLSAGSSLSAGGAHNLAITPDRRLVAWGANHYGQLGTGTAGGPVPARVPLTNPAIVAAGGFHSMAIQA